MKKVESEDIADEDEEKYDMGDEKEGERRRVRNAGIVEREEESFGTARRKRRERGTEEEVDAEEVSESRDEGSGRDTDETKNDKAIRGDEEDKKRKGGRVPKGAAITTQETVSLENVSMRGRRRHVIKDEEEDLDDVLAGIASTEERKDDDVEEDRKEEKEARPKEKRLPRGERIAEQNQQSLGALSFKDRRRRRIEDEVRGVCE